MEQAGSLCYFGRRTGYGCVALSALAIIFCVDVGTARRAETGPSLTLGLIDVAPSALEPGVPK